MYLFGRAGGSLYKTATPNRAHATLWLGKFNEANMLSHFEHFLASVPLAEGLVGFTELVIRDVDSREMPLKGHYMRSTPDGVNAKVKA